MSETADLHYDVVIIGGGVIGASVAFFLASDRAFQGSILVVEKDHSYGKCSTALSVGGFRQQFSIAENIQISQFGYEFFSNLGDWLSLGGETPDIGLHRGGYLFLAGEKGLGILKENWTLQKSLGVDVTLFKSTELADQFSWLNVEGLAAGSLGADEGWLDPYCLLQAFKKKACSQGVVWMEDEAVGFDLARGRITGVRLSSGKNIRCSAVVNAAGPRARDVAAHAGIDIPVFPRKRMVFSFTCPTVIPQSPLVVCPNGVYFRPEGQGWLCGVSPPADQDPDCLDFVVNQEIFEDRIWPTLAERVPAFEHLRVTGSWAGHYSYNVLDQNAVLGNHSDVKNLYFANGFSGHGLQQSPAIGRAIAELIIHGSFTSLDLSVFSIDRFELGRLARERNVV